jgi:hypothetical protein
MASKKRMSAREWLLEQQRPYLEAQARLRARQNPAGTIYGRKSTLLSHQVRGAVSPLGGLAVKSQKGRRGS